MKLTSSQFIAYLEVHLKFLFYCGLQSNCFPSNTSFTEFKRFDIAEKFKCREAFLADRGLLDDYQSSNPDHLSNDQIEILAGFKKLIYGRFIIFKCLKKHAIFMDIETNKFYAVKALKDSFEDFFDDFPTLITTAILPFQNQIIYDGFMEGPRLYIGPEMTWSLNQKYLKAKSAKKIYLILA